MSPGSLHTVSEPLGHKSCITSQRRNGKPLGRKGPSTHSLTNAAQTTHCHRTAKHPNPIGTTSRPNLTLTHLIRVESDTFCSFVGRKRAGKRLCLRKATSAKDWLELSSHEVSQRAAHMPHDRAPPSFLGFPRLAKPVGQNENRPPVADEGSGRLRGAAMHPWKGTILRLSCAQQL